jgi:hypothetical protein
MISLYRKNRRDGNTVSTRIIYHADKLGDELYQMVNKITQAAAEGISPDKNGKTTKPVLTPRL